MTLVCGLCFYICRLVSRLHLLEVRNAQIDGGSMSHICVLLNVVLHWEQRARRSTYCTWCNLLYSWCPMCTSRRDRTSGLLADDIYLIYISGVIGILSILLRISIAVKSTCLVVDSCSLVSFRGNRLQSHLTEFYLGHLCPSSLALILLCWRFQDSRLGPWRLLVWSWCFGYMIYVEWAGIELDILFISLQTTFYLSCCCAWDRITILI